MCIRDRLFSPLDDGSVEMTNSFNPDESIFYSDKDGNVDPNLKILENRFQNEKERKLISSVEIKAPHLDKFASKSNESVVLSKKYKNVQLLLNDDPNFINDLIPKKKEKKKERKLININPMFNHKKKKRKYVIEGLDDLGIYDVSSLQKKKKHRFHLNIPVRILSHPNKKNFEDLF